MNLKQILLICLGVCLCLLLSPLYTMAQENRQSADPVISEIIIEIISNAKNRSHLEDMAESLIYLRQGEPFSEKKLQDSLTALKRSKLFQGIDIPDPDWKKAEIILTFRLTPFQRIKDIEIKGVSSLAGKEILKAMTIHKGDVFKNDRLPSQKAIISRGLINNGYIKPEVKVSALEDDEDGHYKIIVDIDKGELSYNNVKRIKDIKIKGAFPLFEKEILNVMTIYTGDDFNSDKLPEQEAAISRLFINNGYISPEVTVFSVKDYKDGHYKVFVDINKGDFYKIHNMEFKGNRAFSDTRLKMKTSLWKDPLFFSRMRRFIEKELNQDIKKLIQFYRKKGYAEIEINADVKKDKQEKKVDIVISVNEGPKYNIEFQGNKEFWDFTLKKEMVLEKQGNKNDIGLRKSIRNIRELYKKAGYTENRVTMEDKELDKKDISVRKISIIIEEGPRSIVDRIEISGNQAVESGNIEDQILTRTPGIIADGEFVPKTLEEDKNAIQSLYLKKGYMNAEVKEEISWKEEDGEKLASVNLNVNEGVQTLITSLTFKGLKVISEDQALEVIALKKGEPFRKYMIKSDQNAIAALISEKGYPHVDVKGEAVISPDNKGAALTYTVDEGPYVEMGQVYVKGNFRTKERIILDELEVVPGEPFSLKKMLETHRNIRNIKALNSADFKVTGLDEKAEKVNLIIDTEEKKPYFVQFGAGYDTRRNIYFNIKAGDHNLFGLNKDAWIGAEISQIGYRGEVSVTEPRFFGSRISSTASTFAEQVEEFNQDFGTRTYGASLGLDRKLWNYLSARVSFRYEFREQYLTEEKFVPPEDEDKYDPRSILVSTPALVYNSTDSFIRPKKGIYSSLSIDISKGLGDTLDDFLKYNFETRYYYTPFEPLTFALRGRYGYLEPFGGSSDVPDDQLFFLGGTSDVRGFDENRLRFDRTGDPEGGRNEILGSLEARIDMGMNFELTGFYDIGSIQNVWDTEESDKFRSSAGAGLRYITPIGPVGFLYGWNLDRREGESSGRFHFTLGYTF